MKTYDLKEIFTNVSAFGAFALSFILPSLFLIIPFVVLDVPFLLAVLLYLFAFAVPTGGGVMFWIVWVWSFIIQVQQPFDTFAIIYYIVLALWLIICVIPAFIRSVRSLHNPTKGKSGAKVAGRITRKIIKKLGFQSDLNIFNQMFVLLGIMVESSKGNTAFLSSNNACSVDSYIYGFYTLSLCVENKSTDAGIPLEFVDEYSKDSLRELVSAIKSLYGIDTATASAIIRNRIGEYDKARIKFASTGDSFDSHKNIYADILQMDLRNESLNEYKPTNTYLLSFTDRMNCMKEISIYEKNLLEVSEEYVNGLIAVFAKVLNEQSEIK